jgi:hypothetical protein
MITADSIRLFWGDDLEEHHPLDSVNLSDYFSVGDSAPRRLIDTTDEERVEVLRVLDEREAASGAPHGEGSISSAVAAILHGWSDEEVVEHLDLDARELPFYRARPYFFTVHDFAMVHACFDVDTEEFFRMLEDHGYVPRPRRDAAPTASESSAPSLARLSQLQARSGASFAEVAELDGTLVKLKSKD